jgi:hypothetical protein
VTATMRFTDTAGLLPHLAREEAQRRHQYDLGPVLEELDRSEG